MSDRLIIDLWGATVSADGIVAAVVIVLRSCFCNGGYDRPLSFEVATVNAVARARRCWTPADIENASGVAGFLRV
jgi:hypothetical protein